jgi:hypothetical protein
MTTNENEKSYADDDPEPLTDEQLVAYASAFRLGLIGRELPTRKCFMVCAPLVAMLAIIGIKAEMIESDLGWMNHFWLRLADGRALDPTADQFNYLDNAKMPAVYLGPPTKYHQRKELR